METDEAAPTGNWQARVLVGGMTFSKTLKIETVVPNRLKIVLDAGRDVLVRKDMPFDAAVTAQWLHGAPAANLKFDVSARLARRPTRFDRYQDYSFDDPARDFEGATVEVAKGSLDAQGRGTARIDIDPRQPSPGMLEASFTSRVFEESGDFSVDSFALPFHPYDAYVGVRAPKGDPARGMLLTDKDQEVSIVTVDPAGRPVSRDKVLVSLYKIEWKWWWDRSGESLAQYVSDVQTRPLLKGEVSTRDGAGKWTFQIHYPDWGRYLDPGRGPRERPRLGPDRLHRLAGLGRTGPRGRRGRRDGAQLHRRQARVQGRGEGRHLPARSRPGPGPGVYRERHLGHRQVLGVHGQGREPLRDPAYGGHDAQRLRPRHAHPAAPRQGERHADPALRRHPHPRRGPRNTPRAR